MPLTQEDRLRTIEMLEKEITDRQDKLAQLKKVYDLVDKDVFWELAEEIHAVRGFPEAEVWERDEGVRRRYVELARRIVEKSGTEADTAFAMMLLKALRMMRVR
jgi:hypothetical protein